MQPPYPWLEADLRHLLAMRAALPHALLMVGASGIGKSQLAWSFAAALLCERAAGDGGACGVCPACGWVAQGTHPDVRLLAPVEEDEEGKEKGSRDIRIAQVRSLAGFLSIGAHRGGRKLVIVDPADALNTPAANALLKTLEEPPGDTVFLLVSSRADVLPPTIRSRCVVFPVSAPGPESARAWLLDALRKPASESSDAPRPSGPGVARAPAVPDVDGWLAAAGGSPLRALAFADPALAGAHRLVIDTVAAMPGLGALEAAEAIAAVHPRDWMPILQGWVADFGRVFAGAVPRRHPGHSDRLQDLARSTTLSALTAFEAWLRPQSRSSQHPLNARLFAEEILMRYESLFASNGRGRT